MSDNFPMPDVRVFVSGLGWITADSLDDDSDEVLDNIIWPECNVRDGEPVRLITGELDCPYNGQGEV